MFKKAFASLRLCGKRIRCLNKAGEDDSQDDHRDLCDVEFVAFRGFKDDCRRNVEKYPDYDRGDLRIILIQDRQIT